MQARGDRRKWSHSDDDNEDRRGGNWQNDQSPSWGNSGNNYNQSSGGGSSNSGSGNNGNNNSNSNSNSNGSNGNSNNGKNSQDDDSGGSARSAGNDRNSDDDNSQKSSRSRSGPSGDDGGGDQGTPRTVLDLVTRMFQPAAAADSTAQETPSGSKPTQDSKHKWQTQVSPTAADAARKGHEHDAHASRRASDKTAAAKSGPAAAKSGPVAAKPGAAQPGPVKTSDAARRLRTARAAGPVAPPKPAAIKSDVLLGIGISNAGLRHAQARGFRQLAMTEVGVGRVTEFAIPDGMDPFAAKALLQRDLPAEVFTYSVRYTLVPQGDSKTTPSSLDRDVAGARASGHRCEGDRCYASGLVGWRPNLSSCTRRVRVGIVDTAVDLSHPSLAHMRWKLGSFGHGGVADAKTWHGTGVAALLAGATESLTPGLIPDTDFLLADIFSVTTDGALESDSVGLLRALYWLDTLKVNVVNLSISGARDEAVEATIAAMAAKGVVFVAAAGNDGPNGAPSYPAAYPPVIAVTAVNRELNSYHNATRGNYIDVAAPGVRIWTALPDGRMGYRTGTSFATPFVTSVIAAIYPSTPVKTKAALLRRLTFKDLGPPGRDPIYGRGLLLAPEACIPAVRHAPLLAKSGGTPPLIRSAAGVP